MFLQNFELTFSMTRLLVNASSDTQLNRTLESAVLTSDGRDRHRDGLAGGSVRVSRPCITPRRKTRLAGVPNYQG